MYLYSLLKVCTIDDCGPVYIRLYSSTSFDQLPNLIQIVLQLEVICQFSRHYKQCQCQIFIEYIHACIQMFHNWMDHFECDGLHDEKSPPEVWDPLVRDASWYHHREAQNHSPEHSRSPFLAGGMIFHPYPEYWIPVNLQETTENSSLSTLLQLKVVNYMTP